MSHGRDVGEKSCAAEIILVSLSCGLGNFFTQGQQSREHSLPIGLAQWDSSDSGRYEIARKGMEIERGGDLYIQFAACCSDTHSDGVTGVDVIAAPYRGCCLREGSPLKRGFQNAFG